MALISGGTFVILCALRLDLHRNPVITNHLGGQLGRFALSGKIYLINETFSGLKKCQGIRFYPGSL